MAKNKEPTLWDEEEVVKEKTKTKPKKKRSGAYSKQKGNAYERKIVNELKEITGDDAICTSRSESRNLDNDKIDIADPNNVMNFYTQTKSTQNTPSIKKINAEVGRKDKPLAIFWNAQEKREVNIISVGEYVIIPKEYFYELIKPLYKD